MERGFSTLLLVAALALAMSSCLAQPNETTTEPPSPPERVRNQTFVVKDVTDSSRVCLRMTAAIVVNITYYVNETMKNVSTVIPLTDSAQANQSSRCNASATTASLYVVPMPGDDDFDIPLYILFTFTGDNSTRNQYWEVSNISFGVETAFLDGHSGKPAIAEFMTDAALHGDANDKIEFERSYKCSSNQSISFPKGDNISAFIYVSELQVQAFKFRNVTSGEFDNARTCILDSSGKANKIVPIAVGAALAGLVVVVLIAYLIGRLRSRRQSSYEALS